ncbi:MAG: hypothetical protein R2780_03975 [Crocinitomicaceae bacterium]|nr:hypothetical protein [Crocinitomicaceae bacterium]
MKYLGFILFLALISCKGNAEEDTQTENQSIQEELSVVDQNVEEVEDIPAEPIPFYIDDFPKKWIQLNDEYSESENRIIYHYCEAETPYISFVAEKGESYTLNVGYGQDGWVGSMENFEAEQIEEELATVVVGSFDVYSGMGDSQKKEVNFVWNKDEMFCEFHGLDFSYPFFVSEKNRSHYEEVSEDCEGLWE